jgi:hypothetical protein
MAWPPRHASEAMLPTAAVGGRRPTRLSRRAAAARFGHIALAEDDVVTRFFYDRALSGVRETVEADTLSRAWAAEAGMSLEDAYAYARSIVPPPD